MMRKYLLPILSLLGLLLAITMVLMDDGKIVEVEEAQVQ